MPRVVKRQVRPSPFDYSEIDGAPHPMPSDYTEMFPCFHGKNATSIEGNLDVFWYYMEERCATDEDVYMRALGESLGYGLIS